MDEVVCFYPARKRAVVFHLVSLAVFLTMGMTGMTRAARSPSGWLVIFNLGVALVSVIFLLVIVYRFYALWNASYCLERDGIRLRWGFRAEDIPMDAILWAHWAEDLGVHIPLPFLRWPGAVTGLRHWLGTAGSGSVIEFMADRAHPLILIATSTKAFAITPADGEAFLATFQHFREMGSLAPLQAKSVQPGFLFPEVWEDGVARALILAGLGLVLGLLTWVSILIPGRQQVSLRLSPGNLPVDYVPAVQLMLLPVINLVFFTLNLALGLFFYRRPEIRSLAYLLWWSSLIVTVLFIGAVFFISRAA